MDFATVMRYCAVIAVAYLLGGIPWALIIGKLFYKIDVRKEGSGNLGATNVFRALGAKAAIATLVLDAAKGAAAVGVAFVAFSASGELAQQWAMILAQSSGTRTRPTSGSRAVRASPRRRGLSSC